MLHMWGPVVVHLSKVSNVIEICVSPLLDCVNHSIPKDKMIWNLDGEFKTWGRKWVYTLKNLNVSFQQDRPHSLCSRAHVILSYANRSFHQAYPLACVQNIRAYVMLISKSIFSSRSLTTTFLFVMSGRTWFWSLKIDLLIKIAHQNVCLNYQSERVSLYFGNWYFHQDEPTEMSFKWSGRMRI